MTSKRNKKPLNRNIIIKVPKGIEYISDIPEIQENFNNDLPYNSVISKQLTGVGGTSVALMNDEPYIIAVHLVDMIKCKVDKHFNIQYYFFYTLRTKHPYFFRLILPFIFFELEHVFKTVHLLIRISNKKGKVLKL